MLDSLEISLRSELIQDGGPYYNEFIADQLIKEPWNAYSSLLFFIPIIFWLIKLKGEYKSHLIILALLPLLFLNGLGSTLFHAFRSHQIFFYLDVFPAAVMSFSLAWYFWNKVIKSRLKSLFIVLLFYCAGFGFRIVLEDVETLRNMGPNILYLFVGSAFLIPLLIILFKTNFYKWSVAVASIVLLVLALTFRILDYPSRNLFADWFPQGTHFLWHLFTVMAVFSMGFYLYHFQNKELDTKMKNIDV